MQALYIIHLAVLHATVLAYQARAQFCAYRAAK